MLKRLWMCEIPGIKSYNIKSGFGPMALPRDNPVTTALKSDPTMKGNDPITPQLTSEETSHKERRHGFVYCDNSTQTVDPEGDINAIAAMGLGTVSVQASCGVLLESTTCDSVTNGIDADVPTYAPSEFEDNPKHPPYCNLPVPRYSTRETSPVERSAVSDSTPMRKQTDLEVAHSQKTLADVVSLSGPPDAQEASIEQSREYGQGAVPEIDWEDPRVQDAM